MLILANGCGALLGDGCGYTLIIHHGLCRGKWNWDKSTAYVLLMYCSSVFFDCDLWDLGICSDFGGGLSEAGLSGLSDFQD